MCDCPASTTRPDLPPHWQYSTRYSDSETNRLEALGQCIPPSSKTGAETARRGYFCQHRGGAILNTVSAWDAVDWRNIERNSGRLQARIVKAVQQKKWNKVRALQHLLTHSAGGKLLAVRRVTENDGRKTPGVDGELWDTSQKKLQGMTSLKARGYHPMSLRRIYIPKANGKLRPLGIPTSSDRNSGSSGRNYGFSSVLNLYL